MLFRSAINWITAGYGVANAAYGQGNTTSASLSSNWTVTNTVYGVANAAFASANNVAPQVTPAFNTANNAYLTANAAFNAANNVNLSAPYNTANAAFGKANTALQNTSGTFAGTLSVTGSVGVGYASPLSNLHVASEIRIGRTDATQEGGELKLCRSSDDAAAYSIDVFGSGSSPSLRMFDTVGGTVFLNASPPGVNYIKFNPTASNTNEANSLDDYEEGTWTPTINSNNGNGTFTTKVGYYIKIGRKVTAWFLVDGGNSLAAGTTQYVGGLPFSIYASYSGTTCEIGRAHV